MTQSGICTFPERQGPAKMTTFKRLDLKQRHNANHICFAARQAEGMAPTSRILFTGVAAGAVMGVWLWASALWGLKLPTWLRRSRYGDLDSVVSWSSRLIAGLCTRTRL